MVHNGFSTRHADLREPRRLHRVWDFDCGRIFTQRCTVECGRAAILFDRDHCSIFSNFTRTPATARDVFMDEAKQKYRQVDVAESLDWVRPYRPSRRR